MEEIRKIDPATLGMLVGSIPAASKTAMWLAALAGYPQFHEAVRRRFPIQPALNPNVYPFGSVEYEAAHRLARQSKHTPQWFEELDTRRRHKRMVEENPDKYRLNQKTGRAETLGTWQSERAALARDEQKEQAEEERLAAHKTQLDLQDDAFNQKFEKQQKSGLGMLLPMSH